MSDKLNTGFCETVSPVHTNRHWLLVLRAVLLLVTSISVLSAADASSNSVQVIIDDMTKAGDAKLHGTEGLDWGESPPPPTRAYAVPAKNYKGQWWEAMTNWGQVYIPREGSTATNTRCQIRNVTTKLLKKNGTWIAVQSGSFGGAAYVENFANNASKGAGERDESTNGGGLSVKVGVGDWAGYNYHFYTGSRAAVDINDIIGVFTTCEARLILDNPNGPDDRAVCKNLLNMGADWWLNTSVGWLPDWSANSGIGGGRSKWVTSDWQSFNMCTLTDDQIRSNSPINIPPPVPTYVLTVNNGTGGGTYPSNSQVQITANAAPAGQSFDKWTIISGTPAISDVTSANTTLAMSTNAVNITATYRNNPPPPVANGSGAGLYGEYFSAQDLTSLKITRVDALVDFDWGFGAPDQNINSDHFSVRWTGQVQPRYSETYTFYTQSDDGVRLWVNGIQLINNWTDHGTQEDRGTITLVAGQKYDLKMEYYENTGGAVARLLWSSATQPTQVIPQSQLYPAQALPGNPNPGANLALNKSCSASSIWADMFRANKGNDGDTSSLWASTDNSDLNPWWIVDLGAPYVLGRVEMVARQDMDQASPRTNFEVRASNSSTLASYVVLGSQGSTPYPAYGTWAVNVTNVTAYRYVAVVRINNGGHLNFSELRVFGVGQANPPPVQPGLPVGWNGKDIGIVQANGSEAFSNGTFSVKGSGADIWNQTDAFHYTYKAMTGDGELTARVVSVDSTDYWSKAGIMFRQSLNADSAHVFASVTPNGTCAQRRNTTGTSSISTSLDASSAPIEWVRINRTGNTFKLYRSKDGASWTLMQSVNLTWSGTVYMGLAVTSHNDGVLCKAVFDNVAARP